MAARDPIPAELDPRARQAFSHELRVRILVALEREPASAKQLAERLGVSEAVMGYHMRGLATADLIELDSERKVRAVVERFYRPCHSGWRAVVRDLNALVGD